MALWLSAVFLIFNNEQRPAAARRGGNTRHAIGRARAPRNIGSGRFAEPVSSVDFIPRSFKPIVPPPGVRADADADADDKRGFYCRRFSRLKFSSPASRAAFIIISRAGLW